MLETVLITSIIGICSGIIGYVYSCELTDKGMLLDWWWNFLYKKFKIASYDTGAEPKLWRVLIGCERCTSGQIALWSCVIALWGRHASMPVFFVAYSCSIAILTSQLVKKWR